MKPAAKKSKAAASLRKAAEARLKKQSAGRPPSSEADVRRLQHDLEVHQIELEMQNDELRRAQGEIATGLEQYTELYDFAPNGYFSLNATGIIQLVNLTGAAMVGVARGRLLGKVFERLLTASDQKVFRDFLKRAFVAETAVHCEVSLTRADQSLRFFRLEAKRAPSLGNILVAMTDISERIKNEIVLRESEARFRAYIEQAADAIFVHDFSGRFIEVNQQACTSLGYTREELLQMTVMDVETDFNLAQARVFWDGLAEGKTKTLLGHQRRKDGSVFPVEVKFGFYELHEERHLVGLVRDITERVKTATVLQESEVKFAQTFHASPLAMALSSIEKGRLLDVNAEFLKLTGWSREEAVGRTTTELGIWTNAADRAALMAEIKAHGVVRNHQLQLHSQSGRTADLLWSAQKVTVGGKELLLSAALDVTVQKQMETTLVETQENLITLVNSLPDNVIFKDGAGRWLVVNPPAAEFFQLKGVPWIGKTDAELAKEIPALKDLFAACIRSDEASWAAGRLTHVTERGPGPDGRMQEHEVHKVPLFNADGSRHALLIVGRDVTEKRRMEESLKLSKLMVSESRDMLLLVRNRDGRIVSANAAAVEFYGYTREELLAKTIYDLRQNNDVALAAHQLSQAFASGILFETVHVHKDGHTIPVEVSSHGTNFEEEGFLVSSIRDITARKAVESKLLQLEQSIAAAANGIFLVKPNGIIFWVNAAFTQMTGYSAEEAIGKNPRFLKSGQHDTGFYRELWQTVLAGKVWKAEIFNRRKDGTIYPENKTITPVLDAAGKLSHFICVQEDISERKQAEKAVLTSENKFRALYEQAPVGIFQSSLEGRLLAANPIMARIFGYANPAAMLADGENIGVRFYADPKVRQSVVAQLTTSEAGLIIDHEIQLRKRDGTMMVGRIQMRLARTAGTPDYIEGFIEDISTRVAAELELQTSEERYRQLVSNARDLIFILASNGTFISVNPVVEQVSGLGVDHWIGKPFNPLVHPDDLPLAWDNFHRVMKGEVVPPYELHGHPDLLQRVEMEITLFARTNAHGEIVGVMGIGRDITLRKQAEAQMRLMKSALAAAANGIFLADIDGKIFWINDAFTRLTGYSEAEALGQTPKLLNSKQHSPEFFQRIWTHILAGHYWQGEVKNRRKDGTLYDEYQTVTPVKDASGKVTHFICVQEDITNRKQMEMANAQLAAIVTFSDDAIIGKQLDGTITAWNLGAEKIFGFTAAEMVGTSIRRIIPADRQADEERILAAIARGEAIERFETIRQTKDGRLIDVSITASSIKDGAGKIVGVSKVARDITERKLAELRLTASEYKFRRLYETITDGIVSVDMAGQIREFNPAYAQMLGYSDAELVRLTYQDLTPEKWHAFEASIVQEQVLPRGFSEVYEKEYRRKDGTVFPVELRTFTIKDDAGQITGMWATVHDITVRKQTEEKIQAAADFNQETIDSLPEHLCVLDEQGKILTTNDAWKRFALSGSTPAQNADVGANYLAICDASVGPEMTDAQAFAAGIRAVIRGERDAFSLEYPCHSPAEQVWFLASVTRFKKHVPIRVVITHKNITARKQAEENIRVNEARLRTWFEMPLAGIAITSPEKGWLQVNDRLCEMLGYTREELSSKTWAQITHPDDLAENTSNFERVESGETNGYGMEKRFIRKNGEYLAVDLTVRCTRLADGKIDYIVALIQDITARKQVQAQLRLISRLPEENPHPVLRVSANGRLEYANPSSSAICLHLGATVGGTVNATWQAHVTAALCKAVPFNLEFQVADQIFVATLAPVKSEDNDYVNIYAADVTARRQAENALTKANIELEQRVVERTREIATLSEVVDQSSVAFGIANLDGSFVTVNEAYAKLTGYTRAELLDKKMNWNKVLTPPEWHAVNAAKLEACLRTRQMVHFEKEYFRKDGSRVPVEVHAQPIYGQACELLHLRAFVTDISERKAHEAKLAADAHEIEQLYNRAPCGYHSLNKKGEFVRVNDTELAWLGYTRAELLGRNMAELLTPEYQKNFKKSFIGFTNADANDNFDINMVRKDGTVFPVVMNTLAARDAAGNFIESRTTVFDNTERKKAAENLEAAWLVANEASRAKSDFLANMSHEIRTPLNAVLGFTHLLQQDSSLPEPVLNKLKIIGKSGENLLTILNDILDLAKIESGRMVVQPVEFSCVNLLEEVMQLFQSPAEAKQLSLVLVKLGELPNLVRADGEKIRRVFSNLLGNAVKFTRTGGIEVTAKAVSAGAGQPLRLHLTVKDTGPGIAPKEISRLFKKFEQTSAGRATQTGSGLGLAISQQYARLLGGNITTESQVGQGSTFDFEVPVEPVFGTVPFQINRKSSALRLAPGQPDCRVLAVDDFEDNRNFLLELLRRAGLVCRPAASGAEALTVTAEWLPQLVLMDTRMPEMSGLETIRRLRAGQEYAALKIISLSATAYAEDREAALANGADDFVAKPVQPAELLEKIGRLLKLDFVSIAPTAPAHFATRTEMVAAIARLPDEWRNQLNDDLLQANFQRVGEAINRIESEHPDLAKALQQLAGQFDAESLLQLLADAAVLS